MWLALSLQVHEHLVKSSQSDAGGLPQRQRVAELNLWNMYDSPPLTWGKSHHSPELFLHEVEYLGAEEEPGFDSGYIASAGDSCNFKSEQTLIAFFIRCC